MGEWKEQFWVRFSLFNLLLVASLGLVMRYKIGFDFPYFSQKYIQHAHSHFAFSAWIMHSMYALLVSFLYRRNSQITLKPYLFCLWFNLGCSYLMLVSFLLSGYSVISIALSTCTIINSAIFTYFVHRDFNRMKQFHPSIDWFKAGLWFNLFSSIGTFYLAYMMTTRNFNEHLYLASVYFYLHFQYNGFFVFFCMGLAINALKLAFPDLVYRRRVFYWFFATCIPAYFLSTLWANIPSWLYLIVVIAAVMQCLVWILFVWDIKKSIRHSQMINPVVKGLVVFFAVAFSIKILLQLGSTIPELSKLAFGFRPVVIAYLHLVLLAVISVFLLAYFYHFNYVRVNRRFTIMLLVFVLGIFLNELILGVQGVTAFSYIPIKYVNEILFFVALLMWGSMVYITVNQIIGRTANNEGHR